MDPILGMIVLWPVPWVPYGWALCNGQLLNIQQNAALYSLLGTYYGGDGQTTFGLPDLRDRIPMGSQNAGTISGKGGNASVTVNAIGSGSLTIGVNNMPAHTHNGHFTPGSGSNVSIAIPAVSTGNDNNVPGTGVVLAKGMAGATTQAKIYSSAASDTTLKPFTVAVPACSGTVTNDNTGSGQPLPVSVNVPVTFDNRQPYLVQNYIIATIGIYPQRP